MALVMKNTFLEIDEDSNPKAAPMRRRAASIPRTWKPGVCSIDGDSPQSDDSTNASDRGMPESCPANLSDRGSQDNCSEDGREDASQASWAEMVSDAVPCTTPLQLQPRSKLTSRSRAFVSARAPPEELNVIIGNVVASLTQTEEIVNVQVQQGTMGGMTLIMAESSNPHPDPNMAFSWAKDTFLRSAEQAESTYIMGYGSDPFTNLDALSFSLNIGCVPVAHQDSACWEIYEQGFCPRCTTCRWNHPAENDMMKVIVMITRGA